jgi:Protein of unknown function (DUF1572)
VKGMSDLPAVHVLTVAMEDFQKLKRQAERAIAQLSDDEFFFQLNNDQNSIYVIMKHMAGNMLSRWTDFRTTDGEKPERNRDEEFIERVVPRANVLEYWEHGWNCLFKALRSIQPDELMNQITIREECLSIFSAISRQLAHYAYHVGQIVLLAKHIRGRDWNYLTIPRGQSEQFNREMRNRAKE